MISNWLHKLAHRFDSSMCICHKAAYKKAWEANRDATLRAMEGTPTTPAALEQEKWRRYEQWIRESAA